MCEEYENHRAETRLRYFFSNKAQLRCCGADENRLYLVEVVRGTHSDPGGYWGWWNLEKLHWEMVFGSRVQVEVCFPYGANAEEERGRGWLLPVDVKVLEKIEK